MWHRSYSYKNIFIINKIIFYLYIYLYLINKSRIKIKLLEKKLFAKKIIKWLYFVVHKSISKQLK
jgi:hypothetical protein